MRGVEIDQGLGIPFAVAEEIGGPEAAIDMADLTVRRGEGREAGERPHRRKLGQRFEHGIETGGAIGAVNLVEVLTDRGLVAVETVGGEVHAEQNEVHLCRRREDKIECHHCGGDGADAAIGEGPGRG